MQSNEKNAHRSRVPEDLLEESRRLNQKELEAQISSLMRHCDTVNGCYESTLNLLQAALATLCIEEPSEQDLQGVHEILMLCLVFTKIGYEVVRFWQTVK